MNEEKKSTIRTRLEEIALLTVGIPALLATTIPVLTVLMPSHLIIERWIRFKGARDRKFFVLVYGGDPHLDKEVREEFEPVIAEHAYIVRTPLQSGTFIERAIAAIYSEKGPYVACFPLTGKKRNYDLYTPLRKARKGHRVSLDNIKAKLAHAIKEVGPTTPGMDSHRASQ